MNTNTNIKEIIINNTMNNGGCSINKEYKSPISGYMVAIKEEFNSIEDMLNEHLNEGEFYGTWLDSETNKTFYDISKNVKTLGEAMKIGKLNKQISIYDIDNDTVIYL